MKKKIAIIGSGMGSLTAACLLAAKGQQVEIFEQNYLPGGCTSAYYRQGYIFEAGATTVVGVDEHMPLKALLDYTGIELPLVPLELPMQVHLANGQVLHRYQNLEAWIAEAERVFGTKGQRAFWTYCYSISQFVWQTSLLHQSFPPSRLRDLWAALPKVRLAQLRNLPAAFRSMKQLLAEYDLLSNPDFVAFVDEQLLITAQNTHEQVNVLFGATALCYTNYTNYYIPGGLIQLVRPLIEYVEQRGGQLHLRRGVERVETLADGRYRLHHKEQYADFEVLLSGIPINNTLALWQGEVGEGLRRRLGKKLLDSPQLNSAFQLGLGFDLEHWPKALHHQIHLPEPLPQIGSKSIFLSLSHPEDVFRAPRGQAVASISTHIPNPGQRAALDKPVLEAYILDVLAQKGLVNKADIRYQHSSDMLSWERWTGRAMGFVGGYPQWLNIKPWQMLDARLDHRRAYLCGDTTYPGQGIPGTCLSGWIAVRKMELDGVFK